MTIHFYIVILAVAGGSLGNSHIGWSVGMYDCLVVGAGPAGLFFADEFLKRNPQKTIAIIDAGVILVKAGLPFGRLRRV